MKPIVNRLFTLLCLFPSLWLCRGHAQPWMMDFATSSSCTSCIPGCAYAPSNVGGYNSGNGASGLPGFFQQALAGDDVGYCPNGFSFAGDFTFEGAFRFVNAASTTLFWMDGYIGMTWDFQAINVYYNIGPVGSPIWDSRQVPLNGAGRYCSSYYLDGNWHHFALRAEQFPTGVFAPDNQLVVFVDGQAMRFNGGNQTVDPAFPWNYISTAGTYHIGTNEIYPHPPIKQVDVDEAVLHRQAICSDDILAHAINILNGQPYDPLVTPLCLATPLFPAAMTINLNPLDFPLGYNIASPSFTSIAPLHTQLTSQFPVPRYTRGTMPHWNLPFIGDLGNLAQDPAPGLSTTQNITEIFDELYRNFNLAIPVGDVAPPIISIMQGAGIEADLVDHARTNNLVTTATSNWALVDIPGVTYPYLAASNLNPDHYYRAGNAPGPGNNFLNAGSTLVATCADLQLIPLAYGENIDLTTSENYYFDFDGQLASSYLGAIATRLGRDVDFVLENGEVGLQINPGLQTCLLCNTPPPGTYNDLSAANTFGCIYDQTAVTSLWNSHCEDYRAPLLDYTRNFQWYNVSGSIQWANYTLNEHIDINQPSTITGRRYPTPFNYPQAPGNWYSTSGSATMLQFFEGRELELANTNPGNLEFNSPFVSPGINDNGNFSATDQSMMRPATYLGILKAMAVLGAEYFIPFKFNVGAGDHNRFSGWQLATPGYAQATIHREMDFYLNQSEVDVGDFDQYYTPNSLRWWTGSMNELVVSRSNASDDRFLITGTRQQCSNDINDQGPPETQVTINLTTPYPVSFNIRRQGSTYVFDNQNPSAPVWWQLDRWHEASFPDQWSPDFRLEAELFDANIVTIPGIEFTRRTEDPNNSVPGTPILNGDFAQFTTYLTCDVPALVCFTAPGRSATISYDFVPRSAQQANMRVLVRARTRGATTGMVVSLDNNAQSYSIGCIDNVNWRWHGLDVNGDPTLLSALAAELHTLSILPWNSDLEIDEIIITTALTDADIAARYGFSLQPGGGCLTANLDVYVSPGSILCIGEAFDFSASVTPPGACDLITWDFGDGSPAEVGTLMSHTYNATGNYTVTTTLQVFPGVNVTATTPVQVVGFAASIVAVGAPTLCNGPITLTAQPGGAGMTYNWSTGETTQDITVSTPGAYVVTVSDGTCSSIAKIRITDEPVIVMQPSGPLTFCDGGSVDLTVTNPFTDYQWSTGSTQPSITVTTSGIYTVTVIDGNGCSSNASWTVTVNPIPQPVITTPSLEFCNGQVIVLSTTQSYDTYTWSTGETTSFIRVDQSGTFTVTVTQNGCTGVSAPITVVEHPESFATVNFWETYCIDQVPDVHIQFQGTPDYEFVYSINDNNLIGSSNTDEFPLVLDPNESYSISIVSGIDGNGCPITILDDATITFVNAPPPPTPIILPNTPFICDGCSLQLYTMLPYDAYLWSTGNNTASIWVTNSQVNQTFSVTVWDMNGCHATSAPVTLTQLPQILPSGPTTFCQGGSVTLDAGAGHLGYNWGSNDPAFSANTQAITVSATGIYWVTVSSAPCVPGNPVLCTEVSDPIAVTVNGSPNPVITSSANPAVVCAGGEPITLDAGPGPYSTYLWSNGATSASISVSTGTIYSVTVTDANGCTGSASISVAEYSNCCVAPCPAPPYAAQLATDGQLNNATCPLSSPIATNFTADCTFPFPSNPAGMYTVTNSSNGWHSQIIPTSEHTNITGLPSQMIIGRSFSYNPVSYDAIWKETINTTPGITYEFSGWVSNLTAVNGITAHFQLIELGTNTVIANLSAPSTNPSAVWLHICGNFEATQTQHTFAVAIRNDIRRFFAIDDISIKEAGPCKTSTSQGASAASSIEGVEWEVWPNPTNGYFELRVSTPDAAQLKLKLYSTLGVRVSQLSLPMEAGTASIPLSLADYAMGVYYLEVEMAGQRQTFKVVRQ